MAIGLAIIFAPLAAVGAATKSSDQATATGDQLIMVMFRQPTVRFQPGAGYGGGYGDALARSATRAKAREVAKRYGYTIIDSWPLPLLKIDCVVMSPSKDLSAEQAAARIATEASVEWAEPLHRYTLQASAGFNDPLSPAQPAVVGWHLAQLQRSATGRGVSVAVIDSAVDRDHPDLKGQIVRVENFVTSVRLIPERHGTEVAGIIAARPNNGIGIAGIAPGARLSSLRACRETSATSETVCDSLSLAKALSFAIDTGAQVINLSFAGPPDRLLDRLVKLAIDRGSVVVAAYGAALPKGGFPASVVGVIAVSDDRVRSVPPGVFSAPGWQIPTTVPGGGWALASGSSFSVAHMTGLAALIRQSDAASSVVRKLRAGRTIDGSIDVCATLFASSASC